MGVYIPPSRIKNIHEYKYSGADDSLVSKYLLGPYWNWLVTLFPTSVAPNTITLSGLALVGMNFATLLFLDPGMDCGSSKLQPGYDARGVSDLLPPTPLLPRYGFPESVIETEVNHQHSCIPAWIFLTWSICLFAYQSLDSIDGKQARRTGMAGPLGELFDHGCDAVNTTLECMLASSALNVGRSYWSVTSMVACLLNFYLTTWEEYHTGTLYLSAFSGPVEGILMICGIYLLTGTSQHGSRFWDRGILGITHLERIPYIARTFKNWNVPLNDAFLSFGALGLLANIAASYSNVAKARRARKQSALTPIAGLFPVTALLACFVLWMTAGGARIMADGQAYVALYCAFGLMFAYTVGLLIVAHVTKARFPYVNLAIGLAILGTVDARLPIPLLQSSLSGVRAAAYGVLLLSFVLYGHFVYDVITTITKETGKPCFWVPDRIKPSETQSSEGKNKNAKKTK